MERHPRAQVRARRVYLSVTFFGGTPRLLTGTPSFDVGALTPWRTHRTMDYHTLDHTLDPTLDPTLDHTLDHTLGHTLDCTLGHKLDRTLGHTLNNTFDHTLVPTLDGKSNVGTTLDVF